MTGWRTTAMLLVGLTSLPLAAADLDRTEPMQLRADRIVIDQKTGTSRYQGNVRVRQGELQVTASSAVARHRGETLISITAEGRPATFRDLPAGQTEPVEGAAERIEYEADTNRIHLYGSVRIHHGQDDIQAGSMHYDPATEQVKAERDENTRVYTAITPHSEEPGSLLPSVKP